MRLVSLDRPELIAAAAAPRPADAVLRLSCRGPYLSLDSSTRQRGRVRQEGDDPIPLSPLLDRQGRPVLAGSALTGALRERAAWLEAIETGAVDDRDKVYGSGGKTLTATERLFGVNGFRGVLGIEAITCLKAGERVEITTVALDQFSMAPLDGALFTTQAFAGCAYRVGLRLDRRGNDDDRAFLARLLDDIKDDGLMLGHGVNKGFGWFTVTDEEAGHG
ncbi:RAMP superfamily CRISPR-associated protein [Magnetospirillum sp. UT-4]|uniref:RAMP superfamily CRISPR-associated protein n=1 Tax=Magnetospirillum sp. UT-4 TaxID=2681467 RepID=UPI0020C55D8D|nr:RAMP superfamily CRISPR-associated protein [Magnetospirillum sp. UT-4]